MAMQLDGGDLWSGLWRKSRQWFYATLSPLDQGDFRWEFLVPEVLRGNKTLTSVDKFIVCSTFIGLSFSVQTLADPGASVGVHLSYIAQFFSYAMGDPIGFRALAVLTSVLEIWGNLFEQKSQGLLVSGLTETGLFEAIRQTDDEDLFPILYDQLFIVINGYYILRWLLGREEIAAALEWSEKEEALYTKCFAGLGFRRAQFSRLLRSAAFKVVEDDNGDTLTVQDEPITDLFVPLSGAVEVRVNGVVATTLPPYQLVGEASLLENLQSPGGNLNPPSRATVVAAPGTAYVRWPQRAFYELQQEEDSDFAYAIQLMIARQLSDKLKEARISQRRAESALTEQIEQQQQQMQLLQQQQQQQQATQTTSQAASIGGAAGSAAVERPRAGASRYGAAAEVGALLERNKRYERRIATLEKSLGRARKEVSDFRAILFVAAFAAGLGATFLSAQLFFGEEELLGPLLAIAQPPIVG